MKLSDSNFDAFSTPPASTPVALVLWCLEISAIMNYMDTLFYGFTDFII